MIRSEAVMLLRAALLGATILAGAAPARADDGEPDDTGQQPLPTGQFITPTYATGATLQYLNPDLPDLPDHLATHAVKTALSPDGRTLLVMTSGYNLAQGAKGADDSEYVFVYNVAGGNKANPLKQQVIQVPNTFVGLVWSPDGTKFYVSGGASNSVFVYAGTPGAYALSATIAFNFPNFGAELASATGDAVFESVASTGLGLAVSSAVAGLGLSKDGKVLVAADIANDAITVIDTPTDAIRFTYDLRPYNTNGAAGTDVAGGEAPFAVAVKGDSVAYVSSLRDREIVVVSLGATKAATSLVTRIPLHGNPNSMVFDAAQDTLYVTQDNSDEVAVIDTATNTVTKTISTIAPPGVLAKGDRAFTGATPNNLALSPDQSTLYVTNGAANSVAVISLATGAVTGLIPTGWYPNSVSVSADGAQLYVADGKSDPGGDPLETVGAANEYILQLEAATLLSIPVPTAADLPHLTTQVASNNRWATADYPSDDATMAALRQKIQHVIYIVRENRTFDQILGDLPNGANADPSLVMFGRNITPNVHRVASNFVTLDNFFDTGEVSGNGWNWTTGARETDFSQKSIPPNYANRAFSNDSEGTNRNINVGQGYPARFAGPAAYQQLVGALGEVFPGGLANLLPGTNDDFGLDGTGGYGPGLPAKQSGRIWDAATAAGLSVRDYGFFLDVARYTLDYTAAAPGLEQNPYAAGETVAYNTTPGLPVNANQNVFPSTDPYFRGFDNVYPDIWREQEWAREFAIYDSTKTLPNLTLLRLMHDHMGFSPPPLGGLTTPETQVADNDYAVGLVIDTIAHSKNYSGNTLIFIIKDDAQDGDDHMDAHRSVGFVVGPYVKHDAVVSTRYSTVNMLRTIEDVLGTGHLNLNDSYQRPMADVFDLSQSSWTFTAVASSVLKGTVAEIDGRTNFAEGDLKSTHDYAYWAAATRGFDFSAEDRVPTDLFNHVLWEGIVGDRPYPEVRSGKIMRASASVETP